jgi:hypothetical protein
MWARPARRSRERIFAMAFAGCVYADIRLEDVELAARSDCR